MYHFVRELEYTRYPKIKARKLGEFKNQLDHLENNYEFVTVEDCIEAVYGTNELPEDAVLLTFDDGYKDHYEKVFPILERKNIQGCFFPPAKAILEKEVLDVNKIHLILAINEEKDNIEGLLDEVLLLLDKYRKEYSLKSNKEYYSKLAIENRYDPEEIIFIKRLLQRELPESARKKMVDELFKKYLDVEEKVVSNELYMNMEQLRCMHRNGMHIGSHGYDHHWLNSISHEKLKNEIDLSQDFLRDVGTPKNQWTFCYPYGAYNDEICRLLKKNGFKLGFTTEPKIANLDKKSAMVLPRLDTNEIPY
ncbi:MAG: polysaccharide deacetylase family protein [Thermoplasmatota archaeon]